MSPSPRADEIFGMYHALKRGNHRATIFHKEGDDLAFERILSEGLERYKVRKRTPQPVWFLPSRS